MGPARSAYITVDRPRSAGGICAILRDLALVGQLIANGGTRGGK
jgi:CubicO group peptidase (beta-lactamase class C family)